MILGQHSTWDVYHCNADKLSYVPYIEIVLNQIVDRLNLSKVKSAFKQFKPFGVTGFILLEESHISIHTWPEYEFAAIDVFSCQPFDVELVRTMLEEALNSKKIVLNNWERGELPHTIKNRKIKM